MIGHGGMSSTDFANNANVPYFTVKSIELTLQDAVQLNLDAQHTNETSHVARNQITESDLEEPENPYLKLPDPGGEHIASTNTSGDGDIVQSILSHGS